MTSFRVIEKKMTHKANFRMYLILPEYYKLLAGLPLKFHRTTREPGQQGLKRVLLPEMVNMQDRKPICKDR